MSAPEMGRSGRCTAPDCECSTYRPQANAIMYCDRKNCSHSVELHEGVPAREIIEGAS